MNKVVQLSIALLGLWLSVQSLAAPVPKSDPPPKAAENKSAPKEVSWSDLMPPPDQLVVERYQAGKMSEKEVDTYLEKLGLKVVSKIDNTYGKIPGYLVPLNMNKDQIATELLLVPTLGACIHVPPPPPNQIIYISYPKGLKVTEAGYTPYWVFGTLKIEKKASQYSDALYAIKAEKIMEYE